MRFVSIRQSYTSLAVGALALAIGCGEGTPLNLTRDAGGLGVRSQADAADSPAENATNSPVENATDSPAKDATASSADASQSVTQVEPMFEVGRVAVDVDEKGGTAETDTRSVRLRFPEQALTETVRITAEPASDFPPDRNLVPGTAVDFGPDGTVFERPVTVTVAYDPGALPAGITEVSLRLYKAVDGAWTLIENSTVDLERRLVVAELGSFSTYAVRGTCTVSCENVACGVANGCGGVCQTGSCPGGKSCQDGICVSQPASDAGPCDGATCGDGAVPSDSKVGALAAEAGAAGGILRTDRGTVELSIPSGALDSNVTITARPAPPPTADPRILPELVVDFGPDGLVFAKAVTVTVAYDPDALPTGIAEASLRLYKAVDDTWQLIDNSTVDLERRLVVAELSSFSTYGVGGECRATCDDKACGATDGCGGLCQTGSCAGNAVCVGGLCSCTPSCAGKTCGADDGCDGTCAIADGEGGCLPDDSDGDGVSAPDDQCPGAAEDKDGYQDQDGCPDPDNDGDGIPDASDQCPGAAEDKDGYQDQDGCPDRDNDGDGIPDASDQCPSVPGNTNSSPDRDGDGCPDPDGDGDGDGNPDASDQCPNVPEDKDGYQDQDGCPDPDNDGDGILDASDQCPNIPEDKDGYQDQDGCPEPDNDGDGILDVSDQCPNIPEDKDGYQDQDGCLDPDNDGDGNPDVSDQCPNVPEDRDGYQDQDGCPDRDNDGDGIPDQHDRCPNSPETYNGHQDADGCPDAGPSRHPRVT